jgi:hypothetical protein
MKGREGLCRFSSQLPYLGICLPNICTTLTGRNCVLSYGDGGEFDYDQRSQFRDTFRAIDSLRKTSHFHQCESLK